MKKIEQGQLKWTDDVSQRLHEHLDYRANVILREKVEEQKMETGAFKTEQKRSTERKTENKDRVFYCLEYNQGTCPFDNHHEGKFNS